MSERSFSLFGYPTPEEVRREIGVANSEEDLKLAGGDPSVAVSRQFGRALGGGLSRLFGASGPDSRIVRAERMQQLKQTVMTKAREAGIDFAKDPMKYIDLTAKILAESGEHDLALKAIEARARYDISQSEIKKNEAAAQLDTRKGEAEIAKAEAYVKEVMSKGNYRDRSLAIDLIRANAYKAAVANQGGAASNAKTAKLMELLAKREQGPLNPNEQAVLDVLSKPFMPSIEQIIAAQYGQGAGAGVGVPDPNVPAGGAAASGTPGVVDIDEY